MAGASAGHVAAAIAGRGQRPSDDARPEVRAAFTKFINANTREVRR